jgi:hypothetical protein
MRWQQKIAAACSICTAPVTLGEYRPTCGEGATNINLTPNAGLVIVGPDQTAPCAVGFTPADQALAVGDSAGSAPGVLQVINDCVTIYDKNGVLQPGYPKSLTTFFDLQTPRTRAHSTTGSTTPTSSS